MLRRIFFFIVICALIVLGYLWYSKKVTLPGLSALPFAVPQSVRLSERLPSGLLPENPEASLSELSSRAKTVAEQTGSVLGTAVQQSSESGSLQERAFDYGRYLYCQQVVKDYESRVKK